MLVTQDPKRTSVTRPDIPSRRTALGFIVLLGVVSLFGDMSWRIVCGVKRGKMGCVVDAERADAIALDFEFVNATGVLCKAPERGLRQVEQLDQKRVTNQAQNRSGSAALASS